VAFACGTPILGAAVRPGYSHATQFISELGERGSANGGWISAAGFAPTGLCLLVFLALAAPLLPSSRRKTAGVLCFGAAGVAYVVTAVARCDAGCPSTGSLSQSVHNLFGVLEYVGAFSGLLLLGSAFAHSDRWRSLAWLCVLCAVLVGLGFAAVGVPSLAPVRGVSQRIAETGVFLWVGSVSSALLRNSAA